MVLKMNETYVEWLVKKKTPAYMTLLKILSIMLAACFIFIGFIFWPALILGIVIAVGAYIVYLNADLEYEYLYLDKELTIDKVMAKTKRKRVAVFELSKMEIVAPIKSWHLDRLRITAQGKKKSRIRGLFSSMRAAGKSSSNPMRRW